MDCPYLLNLARTWLWSVILLALRQTEAKVKFVFSSSHQLLPRLCQGHPYNPYGYYQEEESPWGLWDLLLLEFMQPGPRFSQIQLVESKLQPLADQKLARGSY
jgi:hypothetical protein